jgi:serine phosphatase RsbU (regulator of sigma subunit)
MLLNRHQLEGGDEHLFTIVYAILDPERNTISWANGGHPPPLLRGADGTCRYLDGGNGLMGVEDSSYETHEGPTGAHDMVVFYTDGLIERRGESLDIGLDRLARAASTGPDDAQGMRDHIVEQLLEPPEQRYDDVTAVVARLPG